jgi:DNA repair and recombination protein RAD52
LGPEFISEREGFKGKKLKYVEAHVLFELANKVFGFHGWSDEIKSVKVTFLERSEQGTWSICVYVVVRVTIYDASYHEDIGLGMMSNEKRKEAVYEKAMKEAATDATKRALRKFGPLLGGCIYNKVFLERIAKMGKKFEVLEFDEDDLYRLGVNRKRKRDGKEEGLCEVSSNRLKAVESMRRPVVKDGDDEFGDDEMMSEIDFEELMKESEIHI